MSDVASEAAALKRWLFDEALQLWWQGQRAQFHLAQSSPQLKRLSKDTKVCRRDGDCVGCLDPIAAG
jgi:hypothetical protein